MLSGLCLLSKRGKEVLGLLGALRKASFYPYHAKWKKQTKLPMKLSREDNWWILLDFLPYFWLTEFAAETEVCDSGPIHHWSQLFHIDLCVCLLQPCLGWGTGSAFWLAWSEGRRVGSCCGRSAEGSTCDDWLHCKPCCSVHATLLVLATS